MTLGHIWHTADCCFYLESSHGTRVGIDAGRQYDVRAEFYKTSSITAYTIHKQVPQF
jgi:hypothetical protein